MVSGIPRSKEYDADRPGWQSDEDTIYEQDILRDGLGSIKPWLSYIDLKLQHGNIHEQAFVSSVYAVSMWNLTEF